MLCIYPIISFKLGKTFQREYLYSSIRLAVLVHTNTSKTLTNYNISGFIERDGKFVYFSFCSEYIIDYLLLYKTTTLLSNSSMFVQNGKIPPFLCYIFENIVLV